MEQENIFLIVFFAIVFLLCLINFIPVIRDQIGLTANQKAFLFSSSLFALLFFGYFAKVLVRDKSVTIMPYVALYPLRYYATKCTVNKITNQNDYLNDISGVIIKFKIPN